MSDLTPDNLRLQPTVFLLDDDPSIVNALGRALRAYGFPVRTWTNACEFLDQHDPSAPGCLVADFSMPGRNGLDLQQTLVSGGCERYIVFISGTGDISTSVRAMKAGAVTFLTKPVRLAELTAAVREALEKDALAREDRYTRACVEARLRSLTVREREVMQHLLGGKLNKQIAATLGTAEKTIKVHRGRVMAKMQVKSVAELVIAAVLVGIAPHAYQQLKLGGRTKPPGMYPIRTLQAPQAYTGAELDPVPQVRSIVVERCISVRRCVRHLHSSGRGFVAKS